MFGFPKPLKIESDRKNHSFGSSHGTMFFARTKLKEAFKEALEKFPDHLFPLGQALVGAKGRKACTESGHGDGRGQKLVARFGTKCSVTSLLVAHLLRENTSIHISQLGHRQWRQ
jgi:hypothetical protein